MCNLFFEGFTASELDVFCTKMEHAVALFEKMQERSGSLYLAPPSPVIQDIVDIHGDAVIALLDNFGIVTKLC